MKRITRGGLVCFQFHLIEGFSEDIDHAVFTRAGGVSEGVYSSLNVSFGVGDAEKNVVENRRRVLRALNLQRCLSAVQTHSRNVLVIDENINSNMLAEGWKTLEVDDVDAFVTNIPRLGLMIKVADCQAIIFYDPGRKILGLAHAGWKGLKQDISGAVIEEMVKLGAVPANILVGIAPSLGPDSSEFTDPVAELGAEFIPFIKGRKVDLWEFSRQQLIKHGIQERKIENARIDTANAEEGARFYSYRREKQQTGRFAVVAAIK